MARPARYRVIIPTRNSERWIIPFYQAYRRMGIEPIYLLDQRSDDRTNMLLRQIGANVHPVMPRYDRVEAMLQVTREFAGNEWVIRLDDDELPSSALIAWLNYNIADIQESSLAISRRDVILREGSLHYSRMELYYFHPQHPTFLDPQWRGFIPNRVNFTNAIHTPGFDITTYVTAPAKAYFVHFDWILRSWDERMAKLRRYEAQSAGSGWKFAQFYLPELHDTASARWTPLDTDEYASLLAELRLNQAAPNSR